jgi:hypothetical protein
MDGSRSMLSKSKQLSQSTKAKITQKKVDLLESLKGAQGIQGEKGLQGITGKDGGTGQAGMDGKTIVGDDGARGPAGPRGDKGERGEAIKGDAGQDGEDGRGIVSTTIINGHLVISYSDGSRQDVGQVVGRQGQPGQRGRNGGVISIGGDVINFVEINEDTTLNTTSHEYLKIDTSGGDVTLTLPLSRSGVISYNIWKTTGDTNKVKIIPSGSDTIIGEVCFEWASEWALYQFVPDGVNLWLVK